MAETANKIVTGMRVHGRGNEFTVRDLVSMNGVKPGERTVIKEPNGAFFRWQTPRHDGMKEYLDALQEYGFRLRESLRLIELAEGCEITRVMDCTREELLRNIRKQITIGAILKLLTRQLGRGVANFVVTELYSEKPCMVLSDMADPDLGAQLCKILEDGERLCKERGLMVDPLGGAAISSALKCLFDPTLDPILSNLEKSEDGKVVLTDPGLMKVRNGERVSNIPGTRWLMALTLRLVGELGFEAMNMALRDHGNNIQPRPLGAINAIPKAVAFIGYNCVKGVRSFFRSDAGKWVCGFGQGLSAIS